MWVAQTCPTDLAVSHLSTLSLTCNSLTFKKTSRKCFECVSEVSVFSRSYSRLPRLLEIHLRDCTSLHLHTCSVHVSRLPSVSLVNRSEAIIWDNWLCVRVCVRVRVCTCARSRVWVYVYVCVCALPASASLGLPGGLSWDPHPPEHVTVTSSNPSSKCKCHIWYHLITIK